MSQGTDQKSYFRKVASIFFFSRDRLWPMFSWICHIYYTLTQWHLSHEPKPLAFNVAMNQETFLLTKPEKFQLTGRLLNYLSFFHEFGFVSIKTWLFPMSHTCSHSWSSPRLPFPELVSICPPMLHTCMWNCIDTIQYFMSKIPTSPSSGQGSYFTTLSQN